jgi:mono/diheme cytochrome c family protein
VIAALIAISAGAAYAAAMLRLTRSRLAGSLAGIVPGLALVGIGVSLTLGALAATPTEIVNPIQPDARSLSVGKTLYEQHCFVCHGPTGKGDGPAALRLNPRPVDLRQHMVPGVHPDAQLFDWISNGYPNSPMPGFASALSENDRWDVLNYIRTFANGQ